MNPRGPIMIKGLFIFVITVVAFCANALEGIGSIEQKLIEKNQELISLQFQVESKHVLHNSYYAGFYPSLSLVGGWQQNKTDTLVSAEKGYVGYLEGRLNLFRGFKDQILLGIGDLELNGAKLAVESKKRDLRLRVTEILSSMLLLHKLQAILVEEVDVLKKLKKMADKKVSAGLTGPVDNLEFELREDEIQIEINQFRQQHEEQHQSIIRLFGEDLEDSEFEKIDFSSYKVLTKVGQNYKLENNLDYQKFELLKATAELENKEIRSEFFPVIDFTYQAGRLSLAEDTLKPFNESKYAILLTIPLFSGFDTYYRARSAALVVESAERLKLQKRYETDSRFSTLKTKSAELSALYEINEKKSLFSQKYFDLTLGEYKRGIKNSPDLVGATDRLFSAKKRKFELLNDLENLKIQMETF